ncbi:diguanylate cyclase [Corallincola luteus]|uniref:diguanylate cyclase n=1 Tax=Corallincola luteus TaxID=1775177 RepID=A0ABY2AMR4_9GAMM|nr:diguanylate cyclase [Corallincola luteus]TCI02648.1 diguanylate cyclase [Corallincola luteus]
MNRILVLPMGIQQLTRAWFGWLLICVSTTANAAWVLSDDTLHTLVTSPCCEFLATDDAELSAQQIMALPESAWQKLSTSRINAGFSSRIYWLRVSIDNRAVQNRQWLLALDNPLIDWINIYLQSGDEPWLQVAALAEGDHGRKVSHPSYLIPLELAGDAQRPVLLIQFQTAGAANLSLTLWDRDSFVESDHRSSLGWGLAFGALLLMGTYNVLLAASTRMLSYLMYAAYIFSGSLLVAGLLGINSYYLWPNSPWLQHISLPLLGGFTLLFASLFTERVLQTERRQIGIKRLHRGLQAGIVLYLFSVLLLDYQSAVIVLAGLVVLVVISLLALGIWLCVQKAPLARYYTFAWLALLVGALISSLAYFGWVQLPIDNLTPFLIGAGIDVAVMAVTLALRVGDSYRSHQLAEKNAMEQARRVRLVQDKALQMQATANAELEQKVRERTFELEVALRELADSNRELEEQNTRDALTGVRNRKYFDKRYIAEQRRSRREQTPLALIMADIDHFKQINDTYGHPVGDICIREVASRAAEVVKRPGDVVARYGGEEFALILPNTSPEGARQLAERLCSAIRDQGVVTGAGELPLTISCGVACLYIDPQLPPETLLAQADKALYQAKQQGRDRVCVFITEEQQVE